MTVATANVQNSGSTSVVLSTGVAETIWRGRIEKPVMEQALEDVTRIATEKKILYWIHDTSGVDSYSADIRTPATALLRAIRDSGTKEIVSIVPSGAVRMLSAALSLAVGFKLRMYPTRAEALEYVKTRMSETN